jgi:hypothetical protein
MTYGMRDKDKSMDSIYFFYKNTTKKLLLGPGSAGSIIWLGNIDHGKERKSIIESAEVKFFSH